jgi:hypothetical protein
MARKNRERTISMSSDHKPCPHCLCGKASTWQYQKKQLQEALVFAEMTINHAVELGYVGEGSTRAMCLDALAKAKGALGALSAQT